MSPNRTFSQAGWACLAVVLTATVASAGPAIADRPHPNPLPVGEGTGHGLFTRLLNWPEKPKEANEDEKDGEKKDEEDEKEEPLESDRPDFTEASSTVGLHRFQIESGYTYTHGTDGPTATDKHDLPEMLLRYGVAERLELRLAWDEGMIFQRETDRAAGHTVDKSGSTDVEFGFKYAIAKQQGVRPQSALIVALTAPVGSPAFSGQQVGVRLNYCYSWELTKKLSLNCSTGNLWAGEAGDRFSTFFQSASLEYELTERLHCFNEWYGQFRCGADDNRPQHYYDGGFTYLLTPNLQLDWRAGWGLSDASDRFFTGCGLVIRR
jgi:hypothetical protein